jgi:hypothetical protein
MSGGNIFVAVEYLEVKKIRARNGNRTRDPQLGKLMLYH